MIFISASFDQYTKPLAQWIQKKLNDSGLNAHLSGEIKAQPLAAHTKEKIRNSEALLALITPRNSAWVQNEIGIAYDADVPVYAFVQKNVPTEGLLTHITIYETFDPANPDTLRNLVDRFIKKIQEERWARLLGAGALAALALVLVFLLTPKK